MTGSDKSTGATAAAAAVAADPPAETLTVGGKGKDGNISVLQADGVAVVQTERGAVGINNALKHIALRLGGGAIAGFLQLFDREGRRRVSLNGANGSLNLVGAQIALQDSGNNDQIILGATSSRSNLFIGAPDKPGFIQLTTGGNPGPTVELDGERNSLLFLKKGTRTDSTLELNGNNGEVRATGLVTGANIAAVGSDGKVGVRMLGSGATVRAGGDGRNGTVTVRGTDGQPLVELLGRDNESVIGLGQANRPGRISMYSAAGESVRLDAATGDIMLRNADCAEEFDLGVDYVEPGTVVVLDDEGRLVPSSTAYDTRVTGVVSGAGAFRPGLILDRRDTGATRVPVALMGKVYCWVDATDDAVAVGDLLTTGHVAGHAMKVSDRAQATGAIIGKAMAPLKSGRELIPVLVTPC